MTMVVLRIDRGPMWHAVLLLVLLVLLLMVGILLLLVVVEMMWRHCLDDARVICYERLHGTAR